MSAFWCELAWLDAGPVPSVRVEHADGRITLVSPGAAARPGDHVLTGLVLPGLADAHSHAFHRALRGRTHGDGGSFWTWRQAMYALAGALDPDDYLDLARATYAELVLAGVTAVGEFHYLHHGPDGTPYAEPNVMAEALREAARDAGLRATLLDTCYLTGAPGQPLEGVQRRFGDADVEAWAQRSAAVPADEHLRPAVAAHSVRALAPADLAVVAATARARGVVAHVHVSEQPAENAACLDAYGLTPVELLAEAGLLGPTTTAVHAVHLADRDVALLGGSQTTVCLCPSTEQDLGDGLAPGARLFAAGSPLCVGSDQHVRADLLAEARSVELHERLAGGRRGVLAPAELVEAVTAAGHAALGDATGGRIAVGAPADLVAVHTDSPRTAGADPAQLVMVAGAADMHTVVAAGTLVVQEGQHRLGDVGALLAAAVDRAWRATERRSSPPPARAQPASGSTTRRPS
ncbi:MAG: formimidoylglutamate deiminase [Cellulomonas sp.]|nr:formimidoylglutamate deiminase [Cellulomonas sp.]